MTRALSTAHIGWKLLGAGLVLIGVGCLLLPGAADHDVCAWVNATGGDE